MSKTSFRRQSRPANRWFWMMLAFLIVGLMGSLGAAPADTARGLHGAAWEPFSFWTSDQYSGFEKVALLANVVIALAGLGYALLLVGEVYGAGKGTSRMQEIAQAVREGADAYLKRQLTTVGLLIIVISAVLVLTKWPWGMDASNA